MQTDFQFILIALVTSLQGSVQCGFYLYILGLLDVVNFDWSILMKYLSRIIHFVKWEYVYLSDSINSNYFIYIYANVEMDN